MNTLVKVRHMEATGAIREYTEAKVEKLYKYYDNIQSIEVIVDMEVAGIRVDRCIQRAQNNVGGRSGTIG